MCILLASLHYLSVIWKDIRRMSSTKTCEKCLKRVNIYITCFKCDAIYHIYCWKEVPGAYVNEEGQLFCCRDLTSNCAGPDTKLGTQNDPPERVKEKCGSIDGYSEDLKIHPIKEEHSEWNEFKCDACLLQFTNKEHLENHYSKCPNKTGELIQELKEDKDIENCLHKEEDLEWSEFKCDVCLSEFTKGEHLENHYSECAVKERMRDDGKEKSDPRVWRVSLPSEDTLGIRKKMSLVNHADAHANAKKRPHRCDMCDYAGIQKRDLKVHVLMKHSDAEKHKKAGLLTHEPTRSNGSELNSHILRKHSETETPEKRGEKYKCADCEYSTYCGTSLASHRHTHPKEKPFKCGKCNYAAANKQRLNLHILSKHTYAEERYKCGDCEYSTHSMMSLVAHQRNHINERPRKLFKAADKAHRNRNLLTTQSDKDESRNRGDCEYSLRLKGSLRTYKRSRPIEGSHKCDACDYTAIEKRSLNSHILTKHSNIKKV